MSEARVTALRPPHACPECRKQTSDRVHYPFCSERCRNRDLNRWLSDAYVIPGPPADSTPDTGAQD